MKKLKRILAVALFSSLALNSIGQCEFTVNEIDKFENKTIKEVKEATLFSSTKGEINLTARLEQKDSIRELFLKAEFIIITSKLGDSPFSIEKDMSWFFMLANEDVVELKVINEIVKSDGVGIPFGAAYEMPDVTFKITNEIIEKFTNSPVKSVRVQYRNLVDKNNPNKIEKFDCEIKEKRQFAVKEVLNCIKE